MFSFSRIMLQIFACKIVLDLALSPNNTRIFSEKFILSAGFRFVLLKFRKSLTDFTQDGKFHQRDWKVNKELKSIFLVRYFMMSVFWVDNTDWTKFKYKNPPLRV